MRKGGGQVKAGHTVQFNRTLNKEDILFLILHISKYKNKCFSVTFELRKIVNCGHEKLNLKLQFMI